MTVYHPPPDSVCCWFERYLVFCMLLFGYPFENQPKIYVKLFLNLFFSQPLLEEGKLVRVL